MDCPMDSHCDLPRAIGQTAIAPPWQKRAGQTTRSETEPETTLTSEQEHHTCVLSSQSQRQPRTYWPGARDAGMWIVSMISTSSFQSPEHLHTPSLGVL